MATSKTYYVTTPIYYVNGDPHMGSLYTTLACDILARFKRLDGYEVMFLTGTDEHGQKVDQAAKAQGMDTKAFTDKMSKVFRDFWPQFNISNDDFIRTTEPRHYEAAQALWKKLEAKGDIYLGKYGGWYAIRDEAYYGEDELKPGPNKDTKIAPSGAECKWVEEESYFFKLSEWQDRLLAFYDANPDFIQPSVRRNEVISFVKSGLKDLSISRTTFDWGVPVPGHPEHVMYVWIDALTNYITALGYPDENAEKMKKFWPADVHVVGKDIIRFHCVYWPAFLMSAELQPPKKVFAQGLWLSEGQKMSKSIGNVITLDQLMTRYGIDQTRFVLFRDVPYGNDGDFNHSNAILRINSDLANGLGNLAQRSLSMIAKNFEGKLPDNSKLSSEDQVLLEQAYTLPEKCRVRIDKIQFHNMLEDVFKVVGEANAYIDTQAPWTLKKTDPERMGSVLYTLAEVVRCLSIMIQPFMPDSAAKLLDQLEISSDKRNFSCINAENALKSGVILPTPQGVFPRLEVEKAA